MTARARKYWTWKRYYRDARARGCDRLDHLDRYLSCVMVAGCQRSGTTILTRVITASTGFTRFQYSRDEELDSAVILGGATQPDEAGRYCFQTTFLDECYYEYAGMSPEQKLIWVVREPYAVVYSMLYNWRRSALDLLFADCGQELASDRERQRYRFMRPWGVSSLRKACLGYNSKSAQIREIRGIVPPKSLLIINYEDLVGNPLAALPMVFDFIGEPWQPAYADPIRQPGKPKSDQLSARERHLVAELCEPVYRDIYGLALSVA